MRNRWLNLPALLLCLILALPAISLPIRALGHPPRKAFTKAELAAVIDAMAAKGHPRDYLEQVIYGARLRKLDAVVGFNTMNKESTRDYSDFLKPPALRISRRFKARYRTLLGRAEQAHGVPREVIVALLQVETQFGRARQPFRVLEVYTTLLLATGPEALERHYQRLKPNYEDLERENLEQRLEAKRAFALEQLSALVAIGLRNGVDIARLRGSYAGAFGMPQFIPTSYLRWAADGNNDNTISLNNVPDAVFSVANYLKIHGWPQDGDEEKQRKSVYAYNNSPPYVDAVLAVSRAITPVHITPKEK